MPTAENHLNENTTAKNTAAKNVPITHTEKNTTYAAEDTTTDTKTE